jgi:hypothetical protein
MYELPYEKGFRVTVIDDLSTGKLPTLNVEVRQMKLALQSAF